MTTQGTAALRRVKANLAKYGWRQRAYGTRRRPQCLLGATGTVTRTPAVHNEIRDRLKTAIKSCGFGSGKRIPTFNDNPGRTLDQINSVLDRAIEADVTSTGAG